MKESTFQGQVKRSIDLYCRNKGILGFSQKIPDLGFKNDYDGYFLMEGGRFISYELKVSRLKTGFSFKALFKYREHQIRALIRDQKMGFESWVIVAYKTPNGRFKALAINPYTVDTYFKLGKLMSLEEAHRQGVELPRIRNEIRRESLYCLKPILE